MPLCWNQPICTPGLLLGAKFVVVFQLIGIFNRKQCSSFFDHNMKFLCYSAALCIQIQTNRFQFERSGLKCITFSGFCKY